MRCCADDRVMIEYLEGELEGPAAAEIGQHVASCDQCHAALLRLRAVRTAVADRARGLGPPDESFWQANLESVARATWLKSEPAGVVRRGRLRKLAPMMAVAAVLLLALIGALRTGAFGPDARLPEVTVAGADTVSAEALVDSLYRLARLAGQYQLAWRTIESIDEFGASSDSFPYDETGMTYPVTGNVYDALLEMEDEQVEQVLYVLASN